MNSPTSESREKPLSDERVAAPALIRYPLSVVRYPLLALTNGGQRTANRPAAPSFAMARPRRMKQSARALLGWIPFWFVVVQFVLLAWMDENWQPNRVRVERDKWKQLHERLAEMPDRPLILMLGSSRADWSFQAGRMTGQPGPDGRPLLAYNFGVPTTGPLHEALYVNDLLDEGIRPRLLLVEFVATHLNQSRRGILSEEHFTMPPWLTAHQLRFLRPYFSNSRRMTVGWLEACLAPCYGYRLAFHEHMQGVHSMARPWDQAERPMDSWGSRILFDDPNTPEFRARRWAGAFQMYQESLQRFRVGALPLRALRDLLARCRREHIAVALVLMPVTREFQGLYNPQGLVELANIVAELREQYGTELIDATDWLDREDFDDGHHVITAGGRKFTLRMIDEVQKILARSNPTDELSRDR